MAIRVGRTEIKNTYWQCLVAFGEDPGDVECTVDGGGTTKHVASSPCSSQVLFGIIPSSSRRFQWGDQGLCPMKIHPVTFDKPYKRRVRPYKICAGPRHAGRRKTLPGVTLKARVCFCCTYHMGRILLSMRVNLIALQSRGTCLLLFPEVIVGAGARHTLTFYIFYY